MESIVIQKIEMTWRSYSVFSSVLGREVDPVMEAIQFLDMTMDRSLVVDNVCEYLSRNARRSAIQVYAVRHQWKGSF